MRPFVGFEGTPPPSYSKKSAKKIKKIEGGYLQNHQKSVLEVLCSIHRDASL